MKPKRLSMLLRLFNYDELSNTLLKVFMFTTILISMIVVSGVLHSIYYATGGIGIITARITAILLILIISLYISQRLKIIEGSIRRKRLPSSDKYLLYALILLSGMILVFYLVFTL